MSDAMTPPSMTARSAFFYGLLLVMALVGGYYYLHQPKSTSLMTAGYAIRPTATQFFCSPSLTRTSGEDGSGGQFSQLMGTDDTSLYLVIALENEVKAGKTLKDAQGRQAKRWQIEKNTADQLVIYSQDSNNPVVDKAVTLVLDKTNGVGLYKNILNRQFQYLSCQEIPE